MTDIRLVERVKEYIMPRKALFGLVKWQEVVRTDSLRKELHVYTDCHEVIIHKLKETTHANQ